MQKPAHIRRTTHSARHSYSSQENKGQFRYYTEDSVGILTAACGIFVILLIGCFVDTSSWSREYLLGLITLSVTLAIFERTCTRALAVWKVVPQNAWLVWLAYGYKAIEAATGGAVVVTKISELRRLGEETLCVEFQGIVTETKETFFWYIPHSADDSSLLDDVPPRIRRI
jgi:hypothetical protein